MSAVVSITDILSGQVLFSERFESKIRRSDGCWEWKGKRLVGGYGSFRVGGKDKSAHRLAYQYVFGPLPSSIYVCHHCDNKACVRPDHLFAGTAADNNRDMWEKGRGVVSGVSLPGESNPQAVLTGRDVELVKRLVLANVPQKTVAAVFGVSISAVSDIIRGKRWKTS